METARCPTTDEWIKKLWYLYIKNEILSFASKWMELENIILSKVSKAQKPKIICSHSYVDFRSRANAVMLLDMGHMLRGEHIQEEQGKVGNPKLESV
jgi:hypothetical protein